MNGIEAIQQNNIFRVNPVNLFENNSRNSGRTDSFNSGLVSAQGNNDYNLGHPKVAGNGILSGNLDFLA